MATKRGEKRNIDDNERISRRNTEKSSEAEKRIRLSDDNVEVQQHRSIRGTFTSRVKDVMYSVFEATGHKLPSINTQVSPSKIQEWKSKPEVKRCYNNLFKKVKDGQPTTYMSLIIDKLRKENKNPSKTQIAYAISICETYLNPNNQNIQMSESIMKSKIINNLQKLENRDKFTHSDDDSHDGNDVDNGGDGAADDGAGAADDGATNDGRPNDSAANDSAANNGAANDSIADDDILSSDSYNTEEEGRYVNSLLENYGLHRK
ncbi:hypothetical protein GLOIN_2v1883439 [Rhizophagus clarus]|uniref:Uncharacterized protein n=1 Tax=Rhizophagus clarus TaxID=94130 RepID=A0A8H3LNU6_9GLOM|nr:hypothetical protein GLOIN_2v1883439 [Rhizophagus clarus]GES94657.1 hypothetical protein GLOIN_2v1883439 [Rhizophagus clarus]